MTSMDEILNRFNQLLDRVETLLPESSAPVDWSAQAFRFRVRNQRGFLQAVKNPHKVALDSLQNIDAQKKSLMQNTRQFFNGKQANNALLTGSRGTGKSTLVKACWAAFADQGLKIIEIDKADLHCLLDVVDLVAEREEKFIIFCDDLSFEGGEITYKTLKSVLDGSIATPSDNLLFYATSNRRHLISQTMKENLEVSYEEGELRPGDTIEEKVSLSERFGLWLSFYPFTQDEYLEAARFWVVDLGGHWDEDVAAEALLWHRTRGARSGRIAWQFARDFVGRG